VTGRRAQSRLETRARILEAAKNLFAERGASGTTAHDLAQAAHVSRATFFNYFGSREELLIALWVELVGRLDSQIGECLEAPGSTRQRISMVFGNLLAALEQRPGYLEVVAFELERSSSDESLAARTSLFHQLLRRIIEAGVAQGDVRTDYDVDLLTEMVLAVYLGVLRSLRFDPSYQPRSRVPAVAAFIAEAICTPRGGPSDPSPSLSSRSL
jgi:AcrR family transcriptional regulator